MKRCSTCKVEKPISEFFRNVLSKDGHMCSCKLCHNKRLKIYWLRNKEKILKVKKAWIANHIDHVRQRNKNYWLRRNDRSEVCHKYYYEHQDERRIKDIEYRKRKDVKERTKINQRKSALKYPEKYKARILLNKAVIKGEIIRPKDCSNCGEQTRITAHHSDYSKPYDVIWLCTLCHGAIEHNMDLYIKRGLKRQSILSEMEKGI